MQMTVSGNKYLSNLCFITDEVLKVEQKLLQPCSCFTQLIKAAKSCSVSGGQRRPGNSKQYQYFIIFWTQQSVGIFRACAAMFLPQHVFLSLL